jgi:hypothetical protein
MGDLQWVLATSRHNKLDEGALRDTLQLKGLVEHYAREDFVLTLCNPNPHQLWLTVRNVWTAIVDNDLQLIGELRIESPSELWMLVPR